jgi:hypothetical protein
MHDEDREVMAATYRGIVEELEEQFAKLQD